MSEGVKPASHIASLMRQHARFCRVHREDPSTLRYMQRVGHFEFGLDRRAINTGVAAEAEAIMAAWRRCGDVEGLARLWRNVHNYVVDRLEASPVLHEATRIVRFEDLCDAPEATLRAVFEHCRLQVSEAFVGQATARLRKPSHDDAAVDAAALETIAAITGPAALRLGYGTERAAAT